MNEHLFSRYFGCRVSDACTYNGLRLILLENELVQVAVLPEKGAEIASLRYKPADLDPLLHFRQGPLHPGPFPATIPSRDGAFLDVYHGGWQELFPSGGGPCELAGAELGRHGEVALLPWNWEIIKDEADEIAVHFWVRTLRTPFLLERILRLRSGRSVLEIEESVTNEGGVELPFLWGHHPAFGPPFLEEGCRLDTPARFVEVQEGTLDPKNRLIPGSHGVWPEMDGAKGERVDLRYIPPIYEKSADMFYLTGFQQGWYALSNPRLGLGVALAWPTEVFPYLWVWEEFCGSPESPWFGRTTSLGLEPFNGYSTTGVPALNESSKLFQQQVLPPAGRLSAWLKAIIFPNPGNQIVRQVSMDGEILFD
jgi:galactose mutarotase-like enzyme